MDNFLVTGGTGTLGQALVKALLGVPQVRRVVVYSRDELKQSEMRARFEDPRLRFFLGDVRDRDRLGLAFRGVSVVVHAAALKQIPALEYSPSEAIMTNVMGAMNVVGAALEQDVPRVLAVSTDKASAPVTLYGATKLTMERLFTAANSYSGGRRGPRFSCVRYGNVAGSRGSVLPVWAALARAGQTPAVTDLRMTRFNMRVGDAVRLILRSLGRMQGGEVFVPRLERFRVLDLWRAFTGLDGAPPVLGLRPGEKLHESLITADEAAEAYDLGDDYALLRAVADEPRPRLLEAARVPGPVAPGFAYDSGQGPFMSQAALQGLIAHVQALALARELAA